MKFRQWCREMWYAHTAELEGYGQLSPYTAGEYFAKYKYWLRREYRHQERNTQDV